MNKITQILTQRKDKIRDNLEQWKKVAFINLTEFLILIFCSIIILPISIRLIDILLYLPSDIFLLCACIEIKIYFSSISMRNSDSSMLRQFDLAKQRKQLISCSITKPSLSFLI